MNIVILRYLKQTHLDLATLAYSHTTQWTEVLKQISMIELKFSFQVTSDGEVRIQNRDKFLKDMSNFPNTLFTATFKKASKKRTVRQNSFFHGIIVPIVK